MFDAGRVGRQRSGSAAAVSGTYSSSSTEWRAQSYCGVYCCGVTAGGRSSSVSVTSPPHSPSTSSAAAEAGARPACSIGWSNRPMGERRMRGGSAGPNLLACFPALS